MTHRLFITDQAELESAWRTLMSPLGFASDSLWFMFLADDGEVLGPVTQIEDADEPPTGEQIEQLVSFLARVNAELGTRLRVAFLRTRPGSGGPDDRDRAWAAALYDGARAVRLPCEVVHLANDADVMPIPWDALPVPAAG